MNEWGRIQKRDKPVVQYNVWDYSFLMIGSLLCFVSIWAVTELIWG